MPYYKIIKDNWSQIKSFESIAAADIYYSDKVSKPYTIELSDEQPAELTPAQKAARHREFGALLFETFLNDNADFAAARGSNFTVQETLDMDAKFGEFGRLCTYGSIPQIAILLPGITTDTIFTQARKDKYIDMVNAHLAG